MMPPSFSTRLLIENMQITPGESVLDLGAGNGIIGIAAKRLGAGPVTLLEIEESSRQVMQANMQINLGATDCLEIISGDLFFPLGKRRFDHILANPPSIPSPDDSLPSSYRSGSNGRRLHDPIQFLARYYLKPGGRLTLVHGSLCNLTQSLANLTQLGFKYEVHGPFETPFRDFYPLAHLQELANAGEACFFQRNGIHYENRYVISARISDEYHSPVMRLLAQNGVEYRMLPHKQIAKTVPLAAAERQVAIEEMVKCILLKDKNSKFVLACLSGDADLDVQRVREYVENCARLSFATADEIMSETGYELGSVAPFPLHAPLPVVLDASILEHERINISSGDPRLGLEMKSAELLRILGQQARGGVIRKSP